LWPQLADQRRRDDAILDGLTDVERALGELEKRVAALADEQAEPIRRVS
jgi:hypothetical protein